MQRDQNYALGTIGDLYFVHNVHPADFPMVGDMLTTNETGAFLWKNLEKEISLDELSGILAAYYEIDIEMAKQDTIAFLKQLEQIGAIKNIGA